MKKANKIFVLGAVLMMFSLVLAGCFNTKAKLDRLVVDMATVQTDYELGDEVDFSGIKVYGHYTDKSSKLLPYDELTISEVSTEEVGVQEVTVEYEDKSVKFSIQIHNDLDQMGMHIIGVQKPAFVGFYEENIKEKTLKDTEFYNRTYGYVVGNESPFIFKPVVTAWDEDLDEPVTLDRFYSDIEVYLYENNEPTLLKEEDLETYLSIDSLKMEFSFTVAAEDKMFKLSVLPYIDRELEDVAPVTFTFTVQKGYNVYNAQQFSILDNANKSLRSVPVWTEYKTQHGIALNADISGIILHSDIKIMPEDIPGGYKFQQSDDLPEGIPANEIIGTLRDNSGEVVIYERLVPAGSSFEFNGNYFQVDASAVPQVRYNFYGKDILAGEGLDHSTHSRLFGLASGSDQGDFVLRNLNILGNAPRGIDKAGVGGISLIVTHSNDFLMDNVITRKSYINFIPVGIWGADDVANKAELNHVKIYDSYSNMFYVWGAKLIINDSEFKGAGGPIFQFVHHNNKNVKNANYTKASITNTVIENYVSGTEAWFVNHGVSEVVAEIKPLIQGMDQLAHLYGSTHRLGRTVSGLEMFNFIGVVRADDFFTPDPIKGIINFTDQTTPFDFASLEYQTYHAGTGGLAPIIQTSGGGIGFIDATLTPNEFTQGGPALISPTFFTGNQFYLYKDSMGLILGFDQVA